jgi:hypothetical protein
MEEMGKEMGNMGEKMRKELVAYILDQLICLFFTTFIFMSVSWLDLKDCI